MFASVSRQVAAVSEQLVAIDPATLSGDELLDLLHALETDARRRTAISHALVAELEARGVAAESGCPSTAVLLSERLRVGRREAAGRVRLAVDLAPRRALSGERLAPRFPQLAAALSEGVISARHAAIITATVDRLPDRVVDERPDLAAQVEPTLLEHTRALDPEQLAVLARRVAACLDPDGTLASEHDRERHREATLTMWPDGSGQLQARLTAEATVVWQTVLDTLSRPALDGAEPDARTPGQRRHDALLDAGRRLLRAGALPDAGGTPTTVMVTMTVEQLEARTGLATTAHGGSISMAQALRLAAEANIVPVVLGDAGGVLAYGHTRRTATPRQRFAFVARDRGCSFPACDRPPDWCETHHVIPWADGGSTDLTNLTMVCGFHHREHAKRGWTCHITNGVPLWRPPRWIDPSQTPRRNTTHHPLLHFSAPTPAPPSDSIWTTDPFGDSALAQAS